MNKLYYGDNLTIMRGMAKHSVDLIYLDPPFNSKNTYNIIYKTMTGLPVPEQVEAFCDTWELDPEKEEVAKRMPILMKEYGIDDYYVKFWQIWVNALRYTQPHLLAYLIYMVERLLHMRVLLKPTGSIYLHCDPTASHYVKIMMDGIFGHDNFRNEIIWKRTNAHNMHTKGFGRVHDVILFYTRGRKFVWNNVYLPYSEAQLSRYKPDDDGRLYTGQDLTMTSAAKTRNFEWRGSRPPSNRGWGASIEQLEEWWKQGRILVKKDGTPRLDGLKIYLDETKGAAAGDMWDDIPRIGNTSKERLGYPTQKPRALLERIISASSNKGDVVFDPFCGCGTSIYAAHALDRRWIGCDIAILPIQLIKRELEKRHRLVEGVHFEIDGIPVSVEQAQMLFEKDAKHFQHWLVERVRGFPTQKKSDDKGVDGRIYFETKAGLKEMVLSVKGGGIQPRDIRELRGVLEREDDAKMAGFLSLKQPTKRMLEDAATAGQYTYNGIRYDRIQFLTVQGVLVDKRYFNTPTVVGMKGETGQVNLPV